MAGKKPPFGESGENLNIYLSQRDIAFIQRVLRERGEDPAQYIKFAKKWGKNGIYREIKAYMDAEIV
jgi:hypothetical protein